VQHFPKIGKINNENKKTFCLWSKEATAKKNFLSKVLIS